MISDAKEELNSFSFWFRRKYNLPPNDPRFLSLTPSEIQKEYLIHHLWENPDFKLEDLDGPSTSDEEWIKQQDAAYIAEALRKRFEGKEDFVVKAKASLETSSGVKVSDVTPVESVRNTTKVTLNTKEFKSPKDDDFEEVCREVNETTIPTTLPGE